MDYTYIEILLEDESGKILVDKIMTKYAEDKPNLTYRLNSFKGLGKIPVKLSTSSGVKTGRLLTDLPMYLKGMDKEMSYMPVANAIFVILDSDDENCAEIKRSLVDMCDNLHLQTEVFFCIAIEEMEAWLLGDADALLKAYPKAKQKLLREYKNDSIIGTWEYLADVVYPGGLAALRKNAGSYYEIGKFKCDCARNVGMYMNLRENASPSFKYFIGKLDGFVKDM